MAQKVASLLKKKVAQKFTEKFFIDMSYILLKNTYFYYKLYNTIFI